LKSKAILTLGLLLSSSLLIFAVAVPAAHADDEDLRLWCTISGTIYDIPSNTCTISGSVTMGADVTVTDDELLSVPLNSHLTIGSGATLTLNKGGYSFAIEIEGVITNSGTIIVESSGGISVGLDGTLTNSGTVTIENPGGTGIDNSGFITNSGTITIENAGGTGIDNRGNPHGPGFTNYGVLNNYGGGTASFFNEGTLDEECGDTVTGAAITGPGTVNVPTCPSTSNLGTFNPGDTVASLLYSIQSSLTGLSTDLGTDVASLSSGISGVSSDVSTLSGDVSTDYANLQNSISGLSTGITGLSNTLGTFSGSDTVSALLYNIQSTVNGISTTLASDYTNLQGSILGLSSTLGTLNPGDSVASVLYSIQSSMSSGFSGLSSSLTTDYNSLSSTLSSEYTNLQGSISGLSTSLGNLQTSVNGISSSLSTGFSTLQSSISKIGSSGASVGTSNDATVAAVSVPSVASFSTSSTSWTQVTTASTSEVVSGFSVSVIKGVTAYGGVLYISLTKSPTSAAAAYAIPIGNLLLGVTPADGQLRFPFSVPSGSTIYVQFVSTASVTVSVQLQLVSTPINP